MTAHGPRHLGVRLLAWCVWSGGVGMLFLPPSSAAVSPAAPDWLGVALGACVGFFLMVAAALRQPVWNDAALVSTASLLWARGPDSSATIHVVTLAAGLVLVVLAHGTLTCLGRLETLPNPRTTDASLRVLRHAVRRMTPVVVAASLVTLVVFLLPRWLATFISVRWSASMDAASVELAAALGLMFLAVATAFKLFQFSRPTMGIDGTSLAPDAEPPRGPP